VSAYLDRARGRARENSNVWLVPTVIVLALLYPFIEESLSSLPLIGDFMPSTRTVVAMIAFTMMAVGLNIVVGYCGLLDLGYVAFYAVGAYTAGWLASQHFEQVTFHLGSSVNNDQVGIHISMWLVLIIAGLMTMLAGILIGLPTLRLRGDYLAIVTLGFGEIIPQVVRNGDSFGGFNLTGGTFGIAPIDPVGFPLLSTIGLPDNLQQATNGARWYYVIAVLLLLFTVFCSVRLRDSRLGRAWTRSGRTRPRPPRWASR
jgi:branched-chain amino acid transport system permease protein